MKKIYVETTVQLVMNIDEDADLEEVMGEINCISQSHSADIVDAEIKDYTVAYAK